MQIKVTQDKELAKEIREKLKAELKKITLQKK